jgi:hypothetical protein
MISPTRSRDLISGSLPAFLAALECPQQAGPEAVVHPHELAVRVRPRFIAGFWFADIGAALVV